jgi:hypothetical protein
VYGRARTPDQFSAAVPGLTPAFIPPGTSTPGVAPSLRATRGVAASPVAAPAARPEDGAVRDGAGDGREKAEAGDHGDHGVALDRRLRRGPRWITVVVVALLIIGLGGGAGAAYSLLLQPTVYGARAEFVVTPRPELSDAALDRAMQTQLMLLRSDAVLRPVATKTRMRLSRLQRAVSAELLGRSNIVRLTVGDRSQARAVTLAQLITIEYVRTAPTAGQTLAPDADRTPPVRVVLLSPAAPLERPLQPKPLYATAAGTLLGLLAAAAVVTVLMRPRFLARSSPYWE